jgi:peroxiredoxin
MWGNIIHLGSFKGKKNVVLSFFPKCFTGQCATHMSSLEADIKGFKAADTLVYGVSVDYPDIQLAFASSRGLTFPLIPDIGRNLCVLYGDADGVTQWAHRRTILIDKAGIVRYIWGTVNVQTHGVDILAKMAELKIK